MADQDSLAAVDAAIAESKALGVDTNHAAWRNVYPDPKGTLAKAHAVYKRYATAQGMGGIGSLHRLREMLAELCAANPG